MSEKIKLFLTRNRLFDFDGCLCFEACCKKTLDKEQVNKALKMLFIHLPLLGSAVELAENGDAFVVHGVVEPVAEFLQGDVCEIIKERTEKGLLFSEKLFSFCVVNEKTLLLFGHTVAFDMRSLMIATEEFVSYYEREKLSVEPWETELFSDLFSLPSNVMSPVIERVASDLDIGWQKKTAFFSVADYVRAKKKFEDKRKPLVTLKAELNEAELNALGEFAQANGVDSSSVVGFCFYEKLGEVFASEKRKFKKMNVVSNNRVFFEDEEKYRVGPFDGLATVFLKRKNNDLNGVDKIKVFHSEVYKKLTSSFTVFYNDFLHAKVSPSFCDSAYMYCAGEWNHKYSARLAKTYGCANKVMGEFNAYNLAQSYWQGLKRFESVRMHDSLRMRSETGVTFVMSDGKGDIQFSFRCDKLSEKQGGRVFKEAVLMLKSLL